MIMTLIKIKLIIYYLKNAKITATFRSNIYAMTIHVVAPLDSFRCLGFIGFYLTR